MKKSIVILSTLVLSSVFLASCSSKEKEKTPEYSVATSEKKDNQKSSSESKKSSESTKKKEESKTSSTISSSKKEEVYPAETNKEKEKTEESKSAPALWNAGKSAELAAFMVTWGQSMNQEYVSYGPGQQVNWYGVALPANGREGFTVGWSEDGLIKNGSTYALVGVYSDITTGAAGMGEKHLYYFVYDQAGAPHVLVTMQNQGNGESALYFKETANTDLQNGFYSIATS